MGYQYHHPINTYYRKATVKTTLNQFSFPDDPILQNTIRKKDLFKMNKNLSTLFIYIVGVNQSPVEVDNFF